MSAILPGLQAFSSAFNRIAMKKLLYILAGLGLAACTSDIEELPEVGLQPGREVTLTGISGTASRTQFVPGDGTEIQFQWSTGDRIWAGGVQSAEAGTDGNVADFGFTNLPGDAPYRIYYNMTGTDAEAVVPTEQRQAEPANCNSDRTAISAMPRPTPKDDSPSRTPPLTSGSTPGRRT